VPTAGSGDRPGARSSPACPLPVRVHAGEGPRGDLLANPEDGRTANPGGRIPRRRAPADAVTIAADTRERYPYRFTHQGAETARIALLAGDYAVQANDGSVLAAVERKSLENLAATLSDGTLAFQMQRLSELPLAAVVVEGRYSALFKLEHVNGSWLADQLARLEVRYPEVHLVFADSRRFAEEWTYRFLSTALADASDPHANG
jgi:ERCC4-type nuclease